MVTDDDNGDVGVKLGVSPGGDFAHRHQKGVWQASRLILPRFSDV